MSDKVEALKKFPTPQEIDDVRSFLVLCRYYRAFIKGSAEMTSPLNTLFKKNIVFKSETAQEKSFFNLKEALTIAPILGFPDYACPLIVCTDSSSKGLGVVFMQTYDENKSRVIAYASSTFTLA